jgi:hypothetical protein
MRDELVLYRMDELTTHVEVRVDEKRETIWLTQQQIADLFGTKRPSITKHLSAIFYAGELDEEVVSSILEHTTLHGALPQKTPKTRVKYYSLDAVLAVGYRVNSGRATQFRIWATRVLKDYLLKGYVLNNRMNRMEDRMEAIGTKVNQLELQLNTQLIPTQGVFFEGQVFDAYVLVSKIICSAKKSIVLIDNYVDESVLVHLSKRQDKVSIILLTKTISKQLELDVQKANAQYPPIQVKLFTQSHDRFLILDQTEIYHLGASLKDLGKKWFAFSKLDQRTVPSMLASISKVLQ